MAKKKEVELYCPACDFPLNEIALIKWTKKNGMPNLAKAIKKLLAPKQNIKRIT